MSQEDRLTRPKWRVGDIIRSKITAHPYRVIHIYKYFATILIDMLDNSELQPTFTLLPRKYEDYCIDSDMRMKGEEWEYQPLSI